MNVTQQPLVSVVTPVYNEAGHLAQCVESVLAQTYQNWDYTIVDNCSTDGTLEIAKRYAASDRRIRVQENHEFLPVIANHNVAVRQISPDSKYCKVVLGDDWIFPECLERMVAVAEEHPSVGLVAAYVLEGERVALTGLPCPSAVVSGREICRRHILDGLYVFGSANAVLYRADLVRSRNPFYNEANIHADTEVCFEFLKTSDFGFVHQVLTFTRLRPGSLTNVSNDLATSLSGLLQVLTTHASEYLTSEEYEARFARFLLEYHRVLARCLISGRDKQFWDYHKRELIRAGVGFSWARVAKGVFETLCDAAVNPKNSVEKLWRHRRDLPIVRRLRTLSIRRGVKDKTIATKQESAV